MKNNGWIISLRSLISLRWKRGIPKLILHEKYETTVKLFTFVLIVIGILCALITFPNKYYALLFSLFWFLFVSFFQKAVFEYTTIFIQPWPNFTIIQGEWLGMGFAFPKENQPGQPYIVGCAFKSDDYAFDFFNLLRRWNFNNEDDQENNIRLSFIIENDEEYSVYIYPSQERKVIEQVFKDSESIRGKEYYQKEHQKLIMQITFCNTFPYRKNSFLRKFLIDQPINEPFLFQAFRIKDDGNPEINNNVPPILKHHLFIKHRDDLKKGDYEFEMIKILSKVKN